MFRKLCASPSLKKPRPSAGVTHRSRRIREQQAVGDRWFREGRFDYVELASDVAETKFFRFLFVQQVVDRLVKHYPSPRDRHHARCGCRLSQLTLRLHGQHSFHSCSLIVRPGGGSMRRARRSASPGRSRKRQYHARMRGFNDATSIPRQTPSIRTSSASWPATPSRSRSRMVQPHVVTVYKESRGVRRRWPVHRRRHLPVRARQPSLRGFATVALRRAQPSRQQETGTGDDEGPAGSLPLATLLQSGAALALRRGWRAIRGGRRAGVAGEGIGSDTLWRLLNTFLDTVGSGVMKVLLVDRGFINGPEIGRLKRDTASNGDPSERHQSARRRSRLDETAHDLGGYEPKHRPPLPDPTRASHGLPPHTAAKKGSNPSANAGPPAS